MPDLVSASGDEPTAASPAAHASFEESERQHRLEKLDALRARGIEPYPVRFDRDTTAAELRAKYASLQPDQSTGQTVKLAGRIVAERRHGALDFADLRDQTGTIQLFADRAHLGDEALRDFANLDLGDWVGAEGTVITTRTGELSVALTSFVLLSKALRPLPDLRHGLTDPETRYRQRYLDLTVNEHSREIFAKRSTVIDATRRVVAITFERMSKIWRVRSLAIRSR
jgi:lysyl-tRNA synthetase class II